MRSKSSNPGQAERRFREAFERLADGRPIRVPRGSKVTQNNVAKEAGVVPSALRSSRFPKLVMEIENWARRHEGDPSQKSERQRAFERRAHNRSLKDRIVNLAAQRDQALSRLLSAEARILELLLENERLRTEGQVTNIAPLRPRTK